MLFACASHSCNYIRYLLVYNVIFIIQPRGKNGFTPSILQYFNDLLSFNQTQRPVVLTVFISLHYYLHPFWVRPLSCRYAVLIMRVSILMWSKHKGSKDKTTKMGGRCEHQPRTGARQTQLRLYSPRGKTIL